MGFVTATAEPSRSRADGDPTRLVVIGNGMVGHRFLRCLVDAGAGGPFHILVFGDEGCLAYDRVHLTEALTGGQGISDRLCLADTEWYRRHGIEVCLGHQVLGIDRGAQEVWSSQGRVAAYDRLVLATGSRPFVPPVAGTDLPGVFVYRTLEDVLAIRRYAEGRHRAGVIGGGLLGLEAAEALKGLGLETHVIETNVGLMSAQLPLEGSRVLGREVVRRGFHLHLNLRTNAIHQQGDQRLIEFQDGEALIVDMVILAVGIRPRDELARGSGLDWHPRGGVIVDDHLQTSDPRISAIGECANHRGVVYGLVGPGYRMAKVLAERLAGRNVSFPGDHLAARLKLAGTEVNTFGDHQGDGNYFEHGTKEAYRRLVVRRQRLVGATVVGDWSELDRIQTAVDARMRVWPWELRRFQSRGLVWAARGSASVAQWPATALVCSCMRVRHKTLRQLVHSGAGDSVEALAKATGASTVCGSCRPLLAELAGRPHEAAAPPGGYRGLAVASLAVVVGVVLLVLAEPVQFSASVISESMDFLWTDRRWRLATGYAAAALCGVSLLLSLRKRIQRFAVGHYGAWRALHATVGGGALVFIITHTGMRWGHQLNSVLMANFVGLAALGAATGLVTAMEGRMSEPMVRRMRSVFVLIHTALFWPLPVLIFFHAFKSYYY